MPLTCLPSCTAAAGSNVVHSVHLTLFDWRVIPPMPGVSVLPTVYCPVSTLQQQKAFLFLPFTLS